MVGSALMTCLPQVCHGKCHGFERMQMTRGDYSALPPVSGNATGASYPRTPPPPAFHTTEKQLTAPADRPAGSARPARTFGCATAWPTTRAATRGAELGPPWRGFNVSPATAGVADQSDSVRRHPPQAELGSPGFRTRRFGACSGCVTAQGPVAPRDIGAPGSAFRLLLRRRHPNSNLFSRLDTRPARTPVSASPRPRGRLGCMTRGRRGSLQHPVGLPAHRR